MLIGSVTVGWVEEPFGHSGSMGPSELTTWSQRVDLCYHSGAARKILHASPSRSQQTPLVLS